MTLVPFEALYRRAWEPCLEITGIDGAPPAALAGNVLRAQTTAVLSFRLSPGADARKAVDALSERRLAEPSYGARLALRWNEPASGWSAGPTSDWLARSVEEGSAQYFGKPPAGVGFGGSVPYVSALVKMAPAAELLVTGVLGPDSNEHGPNESLHISAAQALTTCLARIIADVPVGLR